MAPSPQIQMLRHSARAALSQSRRCLHQSPQLAVSSSVHQTSSPSHHHPRDVHHHQRRPLSTTSATPPLYAQPNQYVTGVTSQQFEENQALQDWYKANFKDWEEAPEKYIIGRDDVKEKEEEAERKKEFSNEYDDPSAIILPDELVQRNIRPLAVYLRDKEREEGSRACHRLRNPGINDPNFPLIPGMLHGSDPTKGIVSADHSSKLLVKTPWFEIQRELDRYHYGITGSFVNRVYALTIFPSEEAHLDHHRAPPKDNTTYELDSETMTVTAIPGEERPPPPPRTAIEGLEHVLVIPADLQMHPVAHAPYCLNYIRYHANKPIKIPIRYINEEESPALKRGGFLAPVNRFIECLIEDGAPIPEFIPLECTGLRAKDVVRRDRLIIPEGTTVHPRVPSDYLIGTVFGVRGGGAALGTEEEEEENK